MNEQEFNASVEQYYRDKQKEKSELIYCDINRLIHEGEKK